MSRSAGNVRPNGGLAVRRLKFFKREPFMYGANEAAELGEPDWPRFVRITDIRDDGTLYEEDRRSLPPSVAAPYLLEEGDLLFARSGATVGKTFLYRAKLGPACFAGYLIRFRGKRSELDPKFLKYLTETKGYDHFVRQSTIQATIQNVSAERYGELPVPSFSLSGQRAIISFLDAKLGRLDELVQKKERQLALLAEKRQALISHVVTRGLNPNAPTKSSGLPRLGQIPDRWEAVRLKFLARVRYGLGQPPRAKPEGVPMIRATNVDHGRIKPEDMALIDPLEVPQSRDATLTAGEIIVVRSGAYTCDSAIVPEEYGGAIAGYDLIVRVEKAEPAFVAFSLLSGPVRDAQLKPCSLRAAQPHLNAEELGDCTLAVPPREEQHKIVAFLSAATAEIDRVGSAIESQLAKLREYRQTLITAAVMGQVAIPEEAA